MTTGETLLLVGGVAALGVGGYFLLRKPASVPYYSGYPANQVAGAYATSPYVAPVGAPPAAGSPSTINRIASGAGALVSGVYSTAKAATGLAKDLGSVASSIGGFFGL